MFGKETFIGDSKEKGISKNRGRPVLGTRRIDAVGEIICLSSMTQNGALKAPRALEDKGRLVRSNLPSGIRQQHQYGWYPKEASLPYFLLFIKRVRKRDRVLYQ